MVWSFKAIQIYDSQLLVSESHDTMNVPSNHDQFDVVQLRSSLKKKMSDFCLSGARISLHERGKI